MDDHVKGLQRTLRPGTKRLNWNSLGVQDYVSRCEQAITKFESLANQVQKNAGDIEERLQLIENVRLFKSPPLKPGCTLPEAKVRVYVCVCIHVLLSLSTPTYCTVISNLILRNSLGVPFQKFLL